MKRLGIGADRATSLTVIKSNMIIPKCVRADAHGTVFTIPDVCPVCKSPTEIVVSEKTGTETLHCTNPDCTAKHIQKYTRFVSKTGMDIDGLSIKTLMRFINEGYISDFADIYGIGEYKDRIIELDGFGEKSFANLMVSVDKARKKHPANFILKQVLDNYNNLGVPVRFTWTNSLLEEKHLYDTYCNLIMDMADNGMNQVLVNREVLGDYLREKYGSVSKVLTEGDNTEDSFHARENIYFPEGYAGYMEQFGKAKSGFAFISSTTKRITDLADVKRELTADYALVVLDYDLNTDEITLRELEPYADRIEILVDEICYPHCPKRKDHYADESLMQLTFDKDTRYECTNKMTKPSFAESMKRPHFIGNDKLPSGTMLNSDHFSDVFLSLYGMAEGLSCMISATVILSQMS